jgi:hypothetical protein
MELRERGINWKGRMLYIKFNMVCVEGEGILGV